jgi:hypothetical protein
VTREKKAKQYPAKYANKWILIATIRLLKQAAVDNADQSHVRDRLIAAFNKMGRGADARVVVGQAPGRGGNRKSRNRPFDIALAFQKGRNNGMNVADACRVVRTKFKTGIRDSTITRIARTERAAVLAHLKYKHEFDDFDDFDDL